VETVASKSDAFKSSIKIVYLFLENQVSLA
jgi:hypothetical protein